MVCVMAMMVAGMVATGWATPGRVLASCPAPKPGLLWSFPADGATDVPTDADLWVTGHGLVSASLDGVTLPHNGFGGYDLGMLSPSQEHTVSILVGQAHVSIRFTTGAGPAPGNNASSSHEPLAIERNPPGPNRPSVAGPCPLVPLYDCFDLGPPTRARFTAGHAPVAWVLTRRRCTGVEETVVWPAQCGAPELWFYEGGVACASLAITDGSTVGPMTPLHCTTPSPTEGGLLSSSACSADWPPSDGTVVPGSDAAQAGGSRTLALAAAGRGASTPEATRPEAGGCSVTQGRPRGSALHLFLALCTLAVLRRALPLPRRPAHSRTP